MSRNKSYADPNFMADHVDEILKQWSSERPNIDVSGMAIIGRLTRLEKLIRPRLNEEFARHDLESWEFDVLATLVRNGEPHQLTPGELMKSMMITSGAMTNRLDRLESRGFVKRIKSPTDGRQVIVTLTSKGLDKADSALVGHAANELNLVARLEPAQQQQLVDLLRILHHGVAQD